MRDRLSIEPLNPNIGVRIEGAHVRDLTDGEIATLKAQVARRCFAVLPGQFVTAGELDALGARFGETYMAAKAQPVEGTACVSELTNMLVFDDPRYRTNRWHTDATHMDRPPSFTFLSCVQPAPDGGGDTLWCNQSLAYETLPAAMKDRIAGLRFIFTIADFYRRHNGPDMPGERTHPLVRVHAETGRKSLYLGDAISGPGFEGMTPDEGAALRDELYAHCHRPEHCYRHRWSKGDLVIWDNRGAMHYAVMDYAPGDVRIMQRLMVRGEAPIADEAAKSPAVLAAAGVA